MAKPDVRMDFPKVQKMATEFKNAASQIEKSMSDMKKVAQILEDGGLQGEAGSAFQAAIRSNLLPAMAKLQAKMTELHKDIKAAEQATRKGESTARSRFMN